MKKTNLFILAIVVAAASVHAQRLLSPSDSLRSHYHVKECCNTTLQACAASKPQCPVAARLIKFLDWVDEGNRIDPQQLPVALEQRYVSLTDTRRPALDFNGWPVSGDAKAPVTVWMYYSGTCPSCKKNFKALHEFVTAGPLKGKAKMIVKPLSHTDVNAVLTAAADMGRFTEIMVDLADRQGRVDTALIYSIAQSKMMDVNRMRALANSAEMKKRLEAAGEESKKENVRYVPQFYVNGRRYDSYLDPVWIADAIEFEFENVQKK